MKLAPNCPINLEALLRTRALIVANDILFPEKP